MLTLPFKVLVPDEVLKTPVAEEKSKEPAPPVEVRAWPEATVNWPLLVVVWPLLPKDTPLALVVPMETVPLLAEEEAAPTSRLTLPLEPLVVVLPDWMVMLPDAPEEPAAVLMVTPLALPVVLMTKAALLVRLPMATRLPEESILWVPETAPVLMPVVPLMVVPVMVLLATTTPAELTLNSEVPLFLKLTKLPLAKEPEPEALSSRRAVPVKAEVVWVRDMRLPVVEAVLDMVRSAAAPAWTILRAVAAVPVVPLTVSPTTEAAVGLMVLTEVAEGTWTKQVEQAGTLAHLMPEVWVESAINTVPSPPTPRRTLLVASLVTKSPLVVKGDRALKAAV